MCIKIAFLCESLVAEFTLVRFITRMETHVSDKITFLSEPFVTHFTGEWTVLEMIFRDTFVFRGGFTRGGVEGGVRPWGSRGGVGLGRPSPLVPRLVIG